jgi:coenzyme F420 hydrogenase subunit beta
MMVYKSIKSEKGSVFMVAKAGKLSSQDLLKEIVLATGLCTGCGACVGLCPYQVIYQERTVQLHHCDLDNGKCQAFCPRLGIDLSLLRSRLFDSVDLTPEIGAVKGYYLSRSTDPHLREMAQHGGTVTALLELALARGLIDSAIVSAGLWDFQNSITVKDKGALRAKTGSKFIVSPTVAAFNQAAAGNAGNLGVVATGCQALALAKMKLKPLPNDSGNIDKLKIVIGLYCGWTLAQEKFKALLEQNDIDLQKMTGMDIPFGKKALEIRAGNGEKLISFDHVEACIRESCGYCFDSTAEFADISVGSARFGNDWGEMRGWNQLIVRSKNGSELIDLACQYGVLEIREASGEVLNQLKKAAARKKRTALKNIIRKSGSVKNLLYLNGSDPLVKKYLKKKQGKQRVEIT